MFKLIVYGNCGEIRNQSGELLYYGPLALCRKALADWDAAPLTNQQERELIGAQTRRTQDTWTRLLGRDDPR